jgi:GMP synthase (glutamine-hydrolysing)
VRRDEQREIECFPVRLSEDAKDDRLLRGLPAEFVAAHWHSDVFDLPQNAVALASSERTPVQAYRYGAKAYGLLFHAEMTREILTALVGEFGEGLKRVGIDGDAIVVAAEQHLPALGRVGDNIFSRWAAPIQGT